MLYNVTASAEYKERLELDGVPELAALKQLTPAQAAAWVDANVTDLASAKQTLRGLAAAVAYLAKRV